MATILIVVISFFMGALPFSAWIAKSHDVDLRKHGSGNVGATNVYRVIGAKAGILALLLDVLKGTLAVLLARMVNPDIGATAALAALAAVAGHIWSPFLAFKGGKGVATGLGSFIALAPVPALIILGIWLGVFLISGWVSLASIFGAFFLPIGILASRADLGPRFTWTLMIGLILGILVIMRHRSNWQRLVAGTEPTFWDKGPQTQRPVDTEEVP